MNSELLDPTTIASPAIEAIDWSQHPSESIAEVSQILGSLTVDEWREQIADRRPSVSTDHAMILEAGSAERPLILKHLLAIGMIENKTYKVWANEYRPTAWQDAPGGRHIERRHNHRMSIASVITDGGYTADEHVYPPDMTPFAAMTDAQTDMWGAEVQKLLPQTREYRVGDIMSLYVDEIHRLRGILRDTITLIVEMPQERNFGVVFDEEHITPEAVFYDMGGNYDQLAQRFAGS